MQRSDLALWAVLPMLLLVGYCFIEHGFAKLSRGQMHLPAFCSKWACRCHTKRHGLTIGTELIGRLAVMLGAFVVWASIPTAAVLLVVMVTVHLR